MPFLTRLNKLWTYLAMINENLFEEPLYLRPIRLQLAITLMEEQHALMATLAHLFTALQIRFELNQQNFDENMK
jgi:hypothetical protein